MVDRSGGQFYQRTAAALSDRRLLVAVLTKKIVPIRQCHPRRRSLLNHNSCGETRLQLSAGTENERILSFMFLFRLAAAGDLPSLETMRNEADHRSGFTHLGRPVSQHQSSSSHTTTQHLFRSSLRAKSCAAHRTRESASAVRRCEMIRLPCRARPRHHFQYG